MRGRGSIILGVGIALIVAGCDFGNPICPAVAEPAVTVEVRNGTTESPAADGATGLLIDGAYTDSMRVVEETESGEPLALGGGYERAGTYTVRIEKSGFAPWTRTGVQVSEGPCGPETRRLTAFLEPVE